VEGQIDDKEAQEAREEDQEKIGELERAFNCHPLPALNQHFLC